jgi:hypothetical protein
MSNQLPFAMQYGVQTVKDIDERKKEQSAAIYGAIRRAERREAVDKWSYQQSAAIR